MKPNRFPLLRHGFEGTPSRKMAPLGAFLLFTLLAVGLPSAAAASCCGNATVSSSCCNIFGCNCDGPCTNFGCSAPPTVQDGNCGVVPTYDTCSPDGVNCLHCEPGYFACNNCSACCLVPGTESQKTIKTSPLASSFPALATENGSPIERFKAIDADGDGKISFKEAGAWFRNTARGTTMTDQELRTAFGALDRNNSGTIEPDELDRSLAKGGAPGEN